MYPLGATLLAQLGALTDTTMQIVNELCGLDWIRTSTRPPLGGQVVADYSLVDLFCGCGGLSLGVWDALRVHQSRLSIRLALDISPQPLKVYRANFGLADGVAQQADIRDLLPGNMGDEPSASEDAVMRGYADTDIVVAGPPRQGHSDLNNSTRRDDPRNALYLKVVRFVELAKPRVVLIENVPAAVHDRNGVVGASETALGSTPLNRGWGVWLE